MPADISTSGSATTPANPDPPVDEEEQVTAETTGGGPETADTQQPDKRADAQIGSAGGGPYPLADPTREQTEES